MTTAEAAEHLGVSTREAPRKLRRLGVKPIARQPERTGLNVYRAADVRAAKERAPGRGRRRNRNTTEGENRNV